jgi:TonB family protein
MRKVSFLFLVLLLTILAYGQDTTFYNQNWIATPNSKEAAYFKVTTIDKAVNKQKIRYYYASGQLKYALDYDMAGYPLPIAKHLRWYSNGQLHTEENRVKGKVSDTLRTYYEDGKLKRLEFWSDGQFVSGNCYSREGEVITRTPYIVEPTFPGGLEAMFQFIRREVKHPKEFLKIAEGGEARVSFMVLKDGRLANIQLLEATAEPFGKEALRVVKKMPRWIGGSVDGNPEVWEHTLPINFAIEIK